MSPDSKDTDNSFKSSPSTLRKRRSTDDQQNDHSNKSDDQITDKASRSDDQVADKANRAKKLSKDSIGGGGDQDPFTFQIKINLPVCLLFIIAFLMRFWYLEYPKSVV